MTVLLLLAVLLIVAVAAAHSWLGERFIVSRLVRLDNLPRVGGSHAFTARTVRFAWHLTTVAWLGLGFIIVAVSTAVPEATTPRAVLLGVSATFLLSSTLSAVTVRIRHFSWWVFLIIAALTAAAAL